jgi:hypothetical protein
MYSKVISPGAASIAANDRAAIESRVHLRNIIKINIARTSGTAIIIM